MAAVEHRVAWLALHLPQLEHYGVPAQLHEHVYNCIHESEEDGEQFLDSVAAVDAVRAPSSRRKLRVIAKTNLSAESKVFRVAHKWEFQSVVDAQEQLKRDAALRNEMKMLVNAVIKEEEEPSVEEESDEMRDVEMIVRHLHRLAFSIRFGVKSEEMAYYVLNALGSSLRENDVQNNIQVMPIFCLERQKLFSIAWPTKDVAEGDELVRPYAGKISLMGLCKKSYWEARFETEEEFDWYCQYKHIRELLESYISKTSQVLIAGTGTSRLPAEMASDGYSDVVAMDYASNVIQKMQTRSKENDWGIKFVEADLTEMRGWESSSMDCVIDKGCLDAMLLKPETEASEDTWKVVAPNSPDDLRDAQRSMTQLGRILRPGGLLVFLTFGSPSNRIGMFEWVPSTEKKSMEWEILQCLEMSPTSGAQTFATRFFVFVARKKLV
ncbi:hypothetical protein PHYBOEH_001777 [Phytophthora boehmeriae]|uniref:Methyltransferase type 11 domain-containing protein n=1 Tax=Phytophthora boehmeriae TaxID=109152 RepID=A0A8T1X6R5_9STRA|nr:hypothetical protein PHYBOEH_001777 [Phytophthora boehmeriae]